MATGNVSCLEVNVKLHGIDKTLSTSQLESVSFLCGAAASTSKLYGRTIKSKPSIPDCYTALKESRESQQNASHLLLFALTFVGCSQCQVEELRQLTLGCEDVGKDIHTLLPEEMRQKLCFRELLHDVNADMTEEDVASFIHLSSVELQPEHNPNYTKSLLVHFSVLMEQSIISPSKVGHLCEMLGIMEKQSILDKVDAYCGREAIPKPKRTAILRYSLSTQLVSQTSSSTDSTEVISADSLAEETIPGIDAPPQPETSRLSTQALVVHSLATSSTQKAPSTQQQRGKPEFCIPSGNVSPDRASKKPTEHTQLLKGESSHTVAKRDQQRTSHSSQDLEARVVRYSEKSAYIECSPHQQYSEYNVTVQDGEKEIPLPAMNSRLVLSGMCPGKAYTVTVSGQKAEGGPPSQATIHISPFPPTKKCWQKGCCRLYLSWFCFLLVVLSIVAAFGSGLLGYNFVSLKAIAMHREIQGNETFAVCRFSTSLYNHIAVTPDDSINILEVYTGDDDCNQLEVESRMYNVEMSFNSSDMNTYEVASGYFGHNSELTFQANVTGYVDLFNCSAAIYIFENRENYKDFTEYDTITNYDHRICLDLMNNSSGYNAPQTYIIEKSTYIYLGLYLPQQSIAKYADLRINGTQNYYNRSNFKNHCNVSLNDPDCSFDPVNAIPSSWHGNFLCLLVFWRDSSDKHQNVNFQLSSDFPFNKVNMLLPVTGAFVALVTIIIITVYLCQCSCRQCCSHNGKA